MGYTEQIARTCYEANRIYCANLGDFSQKEWADAPDWARASVMDGVQFHRDNPDAGDDASHNNWMRVKLDDGWTYGPVKCEQGKVHPCIRPFEELPREQQFKDALFRAIVHSFK